MLCREPGVSFFETGGSMKIKSIVLWTILLLLLGGIFVSLVAPDVFEMPEPNRIGVVEVKGTITGSTETLKAIKEFRKDRNVRCLLVRIESPGGGVGPSQEIYREIMKTKTHKPVVISMGSVAASGGYYIAAAGTHVLANPGTVTGSIGVVSYFPDLRELFEKIGYSTNIIKSGKFKDIGNPGRELTPEERQLLQATIDETYGQFVRDIAVARNMDEAKIREFADGRIIMGESALRLGLIDELGNFEDAVVKAAQLGRIVGEPELIYAKKKRTSLLDFIIGGDMSERLNSLIVETPNPLRYQLQY